jgi:hypothetical protein
MRFGWGWITLAGLRLSVKALEELVLKRLLHR